MLVAASEFAGAAQGLKIILCVAHSVRKVREHWIGVC